MVMAHNTDGDYLYNHLQLLQWIIIIYDNDHKIIDTE